MDDVAGATQQAKVLIVLQHQYIGQHGFLLDVAAQHTELWALGRAVLGDA